MISLLPNIIYYSNKAKRNAFLHFFFALQMFIFSAFINVLLIWLYILASHFLFIAIPSGYYGPTWSCFVLRSAEVSSLQWIVSWDLIGIFSIEKVFYAWIYTSFLIFLSNIVIGFNRLTAWQAHYTHNFFFIYHLHIVYICFLKANIFFSFR